MHLCVTRLTVQQSIPYVPIIADTVPCVDRQYRLRIMLQWTSFLLFHDRDLPAAMVFLHEKRRGCPKAWHTDDNVHATAHRAQRLQSDVAIAESLRQPEEHQQY